MLYTLAITIPPAITSEDIDIKTRNEIKKTMCINSFKILGRKILTCDMPILNLFSFIKKVCLIIVFAILTSFSSFAAKRLHRYYRLL